MANDLDSLIAKFKAELGKTPEEWATPGAKAPSPEEAPSPGVTAAACLDPDIKSLFFEFLEALPVCEKE